MSWHHIRHGTPPSINHASLSADAGRNPETLVGYERSDQRRIARSSSSCDGCSPRFVLTAASRQMWPLSCMCRVTGRIMVS